jgi:hypothetical protein
LKEFLMPQIEVSAVLPYFLRLENGDYLSQRDSKSYRLTLQNISIAVNGTSQEERTQALFSFDGNAASDDEVQRLKTQEVEELLRQTNRLLRWYRASTGRAEVTELARAQASPFWFRVVDEQKIVSPLWTEPITFESSPLPFALGQTLQSVTQAVRNGLSEKSDPEVSKLFLLDAEQSLREGRFRETVLFCWSAIDSTFDQKYKELAASVIKNKADYNSFVNFRDATMRYRMSAGLHFCTGQSLYDNRALWVNLFKSYTKRNSIIHDGDSAQETDAESALSVARQVVGFLATLKPQIQNKGNGIVT